MQRLGEPPVAIIIVYLQHEGQTVQAVEDRKEEQTSSIGIRHSLKAASGRRIAMFAKKVWIILTMALLASPVRAEPIKIAYSGVSASGTPVCLPKKKGSLPSTD